jgi:hypothetical protein
MPDPRFCDGAKGGIFTLVEKTRQRGGIHRVNVRVKTEKVSAFL